MAFRMHGMSWTSDLCNSGTAGPGRHLSHLEPQVQQLVIFGQDHVVKVLLNQSVADTHDAVGDANKSVRLYNLSQQLQQDPAASGQ